MRLTEVEEWRPVKGFEGYYEVSNMGRVKSVARRVEFIRNGKPSYFNTTERILKSTSGSKYRGVILCNPSGKFGKMVHRLVAEAFIPNPEGLPFVLHWDDDPGNNLLENLRWGTHSDNMEDSVRNGTHHEARKTHCKRGHEFTDENTYTHRTKTGVGRTCKACQRRYRDMGLPEKDHRHGTSAGYYNYGCRCDSCMDFMRSVEGVKNPRKVPNPVCINGHLKTPDNRYVSKSGSSQCKICAAERVRERRKKGLSK